MKKSITTNNKEHPMKKPILIITLSLLLSGSGKETDYVTDLTLSDKSITIETEFFDDMEAIANVKGNASTEVTAVSSDESIVTVDAWSDDEEPGLSTLRHLRRQEKQR